jgi:RNA polymerase sigma-70 factor (ECF subfamily)
MFDRDKLNQLYRYGFALSADEQLAWDLVHDAVEKLISRTFVLNKMAYAKKIIRNRFYDIIKAKSYSAQTEFNEEELPVESSIEETLYQNKYLSSIMNKLYPKDRELLYLWAVEEYTTKEISILINQPKGTVTSRLKRLRDKLQQQSGGKNE